VAKNLEPRTLEPNPEPQNRTSHPAPGTLEPSDIKILNYPLLLVSCADVLAFSLTAPSLRADVPYAWLTSAC